MKIAVLRQDGAGPDPLSSQARKNGDESSTEAASVAAPAVVDGAPAAVSHASGLKQARQAVPRGRSLPRWDLQPLVIIMLALTRAAEPRKKRSSTQPRVYVASHEARKRPASLAGITNNGQEQARPSRVVLYPFAQRFSQTWRPTGTPRRSIRCPPLASRRRLQILGT